jgi:DNA/RNA-binding domain of Phe-tRNA-synthetase-like protein
MTAMISTPSWSSAFPGSIVAALEVREVANPAVSEALEQAKRALENELRARWAGKSRAEIRLDPVLAVYHEYYQRFGQNYHVQMQIESIALKGKSIPTRAALVEAMFMSELETGLLTAVQDVDRLRGQVVVIGTSGEERYTRYDGVDEQCKAGDMAIRDDLSVLTSIVQGPTNHALASPETVNAAFHVYAPAGIEEAVVARHFDVIAGFVRLISPDAVFGQPVILRS